MRILLLLPYGRTVNEIADQLMCSRNTARTHIASIYHKLGAHSRGEAIAEAVRLELIYVRVEER